MRNYFVILITTFVYHGKMKNRIDLERSKKFLAEGKDKSSTAIS